MSSESLAVTSPWRGRLLQRLSTPVACCAVLAAIVALTAAGCLNWLGLFLAAALAVAVAYRFPVLTIAGLVAVDLLPYMLAPTPWGGIADSSFDNVPIQHLPLLPMAGAVALRVTVLAAGKRRATLPRYLPLAIVLASVLAALMVAGVARGFSAYQLSAVREFTVSYLGLLIVPYIALFLRSRRDIVRVFKGVALVGVGVPVVVLLAVGLFRGPGFWLLGGYYPGVTDVGIVYGLLAAYLLQARERAWRLALRAVAVPAVFLIGVDGAHTTWVVAGVSLIVLMVTQRISVERVWKWGFVVALVVALCVTALAALRNDPVGDVAARGEALINPDASGTATWRLLLWQSALEQGRQQAVLGEGFGAYFGFRVAGVGLVTVMPHNFYVLTFLKLGLVGLVAYVGAAIAVLATLISAWIRARRSGDVKLEPVVLMGLVAASGSLAFGLFYAFEFTSMLFVGLGVAAALRSTDRNAAP